MVGKSAAGVATALAIALAACTPLPAPPGGAAAGAGAPAGGADVLNVADAAISGNDPAMALKVSQSVLASDPKNLDALYHEGAAYYALGRCEDSIAAYRVALTDDPSSSEAQTGIGRCLLKQNAAAAELAFAAAVQDNPNNAAALNDLGIARDLQGKYAAATQPYEQALMVEPGTEATEVNLGMSMALSGDAADALQYLGPLATGQDATPKIREDYAAALIAAGRNDEARQVLSIDLSSNQVDTFVQDVTTAIQESQSAANAAPSASTAAPTTATAAVTPVMAAPVTDAADAAPAPVAASPVTADTATPPAPMAPASAPIAPAPIAPAISASPPSPSAQPQGSAATDQVVR
jgi:Flp pilus assembly protein TadD